MREFIYTQEFMKKWDKIGLSDKDLSDFEEFLLKNPKKGDVMRGTGGLRKVRWALPDTGKSGGIRVLYIDMVMCGELFVIDFFTKGEKDNLTSGEKQVIKKFIEREIKKKRG
ncbi:MAG: type II toxin-antitoxin system RelE/ParE family toxin [Eubacterium sp.]|jgi:hypothetical protein|nr:type II toxin-antitoxin system RelE/ParE family toxin [Eubacterium sp.]